MNSTLRTAALSLAIMVAVAPTAAVAACTRLGFSVNDYGKEGPARDAQALLDKHIAQWTAERGIKKYRVGPKEVTCELYINLIIFDEHTCKAEANVCWDGKEIPDPLPVKSTPAKKQ
jgi:hypothetical protein